MFQFVTQRLSIIVTSYDTQILTRKGNALYGFWRIKFRVFDYSQAQFCICMQYANFLSSEPRSLFWQPLCWLTARNFLQIMVLRLSA